MINGKQLEKLNSFCKKHSILFTVQSYMADAEGGYGWEMFCTIKVTKPKLFKADVEKELFYFVESWTTNFDKAFEDFQYAYENKTNRLYK